MKISKTPTPLSGFEGVYKPLVLSILTYLVKLHQGRTRLATGLADVMSDERNWTYMITLHAFLYTRYIRQIDTYLPTWRLQ